MPTKVNLEITKHAAQRMSQRGITNGFLNALIAHADIETPIYGGATALCVSMHQSRALNLNADCITTLLFSALSQQSLQF